MALDKFQPYLFVSAGEQSNKYLTPVISPNGIARFQAQRAQAITGLTVRIGPIQEGTGDPSPTNIRPISGRTGLTVTVQSGEEQNVYPVTWQTEAGTVYGGTLDVISGVLTVDKGFAVYDGTEQWRRDSNGNFFVSASEKMPDRKTGLLTTGALTMNMFVSSANTVGGAWVSTGGYLNVKPADIADTSEFTALLASNNLQIVYPLAIPQTYQLTGAEVRTIAGYNQVYSDAGPVIDIKF